MAATPTVLGVEVGSAAWLTRLRRRLGAGETAGWIEVPVRDAERLLRATARLVADLPRDTSQDVVWVSGSSELLVHTDRLSLSCNVGMVAVRIPVECDQLDEPGLVEVPLAVGTATDTRGLFMATFDAPGGPQVVTQPWAGALTAFAWEALLTLARELAAEAGRDSRGRDLVPAAIAAARGVLLVRPMARND